MSADDTRQPRKKETGEPGPGGQFGSRHHTGPETVLSVNDTLDSTLTDMVKSKLRPSGLLPRVTVSDVGNPFDGGAHGCLDLFVDSLREGHLSRGTPGRAGTEAIGAWQEWARAKAQTTHDTRYDSFAAGIESACVALTASKLGLSDEERLNYITGVKAASPELVALSELLLETKRASSIDREWWLSCLPETVDVANWRGQLVAGAALSQTDSWWGFREQPSTIVETAS